MKRTTKITALLLGGVLLWFFVAVVAVQLWPSGLSVRFDPALAWQSVTVQAESYNLPAPIHFTPTGEPIFVGPINHGYYTVGVQLADGRTVWTTFLHLDAGDRRRVDLFAAPSSRGGYVHLRLTASEWLLPRRLIFLRKRGQGRCGFH